MCTKWYLDNDSMNIQKRSSEVFTSQWFFLFHDIESKCPKNSEKEQTECEVVKFDYVCDDTEFKIKSTDNFPLPFN